MLPDIMVTKQSVSTEWTCLYDHANVYEQLGYQLKYQLIDILVTTSNVKTWCPGCQMVLALVT